MSRVPRGPPPAQVVALHYLADLTVHEVARTLAVSEGTVKSRLSRARGALASLLDGEATHA